MESVAHTVTRTQKGRKAEWSQLEKMGIRLENEHLTEEEKEGFRDLLIVNKDLFTTDISQFVEIASLSPFEMHMKNERSF